MGQIRGVLDGKPTLPALPGSIYWLCGSCTPCYELFTTVGQGGRSKPTRRKTTSLLGEGNNRGRPSVPQPQQPASNQQEADASVGQVPPLVRVGLPFLWKEDIREAEIPDPPPQPTASEQARVPGEGQAPHQEECLLYLQGNCPHGISGKVNGGCQRQHRKRCMKFMKWENKGENGCKADNCDKAHPSVCARSLDLQCLVVNCPARLHTLKCKRAPRPGEGSPGGRGSQQHHDNGARHHQTQGAGGDRHQQRGVGGHQHQGQGAGWGYQGQVGGSGHQGQGGRGHQGQDGGGGQYQGQGRGGGNYQGSSGRYQGGTGPRVWGKGDSGGSLNHGERNHQEQGFQVVTAQQLLGAFQAVIQQVLDQGLQLPVKKGGLGDKPFY